MAQIVTCEICLEECQEDELEEHQEICTARLTFRCTICDGNYVNKEGLWNHLDLHEIVDEDKELHYQEMRVKYNLHLCALCNDYRGYQENLFWKHVREEHHGLLLRCSECGKSECDCGEMSENAAKTLEQSQGELNNVPAQQDFEMVLIASLIKRSESKADTEKILRPLFEIPSDGSSDTKCSHCGKEFSDYVFLTRHIELCHSPPITGHKELKYKCPHCSHQFLRKEEQVIHLLKCQNRKFSCEICHQKFNDSYNVVAHMKQFHPDKGASKKIQIDLVHCNEQKDKNQAEKITVKKGISVQESASFLQNIVQPHVLNSAIMLKPSPEELSNVPGKDNKCSEMNIVDQQLNESYVTDSRLGVNLPAYLNDVDDSDNNMTEKDSEVLPNARSKSRSEPEADAEMILQPVFENPSKGSSNTKCPHCRKEFANYLFLTRHIELHHRPPPCDICGITFVNFSKARYHKITKHKELMHKCPHCSKLFHWKKDQRIHLAQCENKEFSFEEVLKKQKVTRGQEVDQELSNIDFPMQVENMPSLVSCGEMNTNAVILLEPSQRELSNVSGEDNECSDINLVDKQVNEGNAIDSRMGRISPAYLNGVGDVDNNMTEQDFEMLLIASSIRRSKSKTDAEQILQPLFENPSDGSSNAKCTHCARAYADYFSLSRHIELSHNPSMLHKCSHCSNLFHSKKEQLKHSSKCQSKKLSCEICHRKFTDSYNVVRHMERFHHDNETSKKNQIDRMHCNELKNKNQDEMITVKNEILVQQSTSTSKKNLQPLMQNYSSSKNQQEQIQSEQITLEMEIKVEETTLSQHDDFGLSTLDTTNITDCSDFIQHSNDLNVENSQHLSVDFAGQKSHLTQEMSSDILEKFAHTCSDHDIVDDQLNVHTSADSNGADDTDDDITEKESVRFIFRCTICKGDYVSKEGLWNHLDLHEITGGSKELHYQEMKATYKLYQCALCNDHRVYQEDIFWKHVDEEQHGFFLRCSACGESFRTQKLKTEHDLCYCKAREQKLTSNLEVDQEFSNIVLPIQVGNMASLISCEAMNENTALNFELLQGELSNVPGKDYKCSEINIAKLIRKHCNEGNDIDYQLGEVSLANMNVAKDTDTNMTENKPEVHLTASSKSRIESKVDAEKMLQPLVESPSYGSSNIHMKFSCELCGHKFNNFASVNVHITRVHSIMRD